MTNTIQVRRGANADLPVLVPGEFGFSTDSHQLYIGDGTTNHEVALTPDRTRHIWLGSPHHITGQSEFFGIDLDPDADEYAVYSFFLPTDFVSIGNIYVYYKSGAAGGHVVLDIHAYYSEADETIDLNHDSDVGNIISTPDANTHRYLTSGLLASATINDRIVIYVNRDADNSSDDNVADLVILGALVEYTADM